MRKNLFKIHFKSMVIMLIMSSLIIIPTNYIHAQAVSYLDTDNAVYSNINADYVYKDGLYYSVVSMTYQNGTYGDAILTSTDHENWTLLQILSNDGIEEPQPKSIWILHNEMIISLRDRNGDICYISPDGQFWQSVDLNYEDITYDSGKYWAIDAQGDIGFSSNFTHWEKLTGLSDSPDDIKRTPANICVTPDLIIVSHYNPNWGSENYKYGLEVYQRQSGTWLETNGYDGHIGTTKDILYTGDEFILAYQNDYEYNSPIIFYTSSDGINWQTGSDKTSLLRGINALSKEDSSVNFIISALRTQIEDKALHGEAVSVLVTLDGDTIDFDQGALLINSRVLVPVRKVFEALGGTVTWNNDEQKVTGQVDDDTIELTIGSQTAYINGEPYTLDVPAQIVNSRTLVPVRFVAESLGKEVAWDQDRYAVNLASKSMD